MNSVYVVSGSTGEYSDKREWIVGWFATKAEADEFQSECKRLAPECKYEGGALVHPLDPHFQIDYTGTFYHVAEIPKVVWKRVSASAPPEPSQSK